MYNGRPGGAEPGGAGSCGGFFWWERSEQETDVAADHEEASQRSGRSDNLGQLAHSVDEEEDEHAGTGQRVRSGWRARREGVRRGARRRGQTDFSRKRRSAWFVNEIKYQSSAVQCANSGAQPRSALLTKIDPENIVTPSAISGPAELKKTIIRTSVSRQGCQSRHD